MVASEPFKVPPLSNSHPENRTGREASYGGCCCSGGAAGARQMRYGAGPARGGATVTAVLLLALVAAGLGYWRLRTVNQDLATELRRIESLLMTAEEKSALLEQQRLDAAQALKRSGSELQHLQQLRDEDTTRCKHVQENLEQLSETHSALQRTIEEDREQQEGEMQDASRKLGMVEAELQNTKTELQTAQTQLQNTREDLRMSQSELESSRADAAQDRTLCQRQVHQLESRLAQCEVAAPGPAQPQLQQQPGDSARRWPGLRVPGPAELEGASLQAAARLNHVQQQRRVLPAPPAAGGAAVGASSSRAPPIQQIQQPNLQPQPVAPGAAAVDGPGVLVAPELQKQSQDGPGVVPAPELQKQPQDGPGVVPAPELQKQSQDGPDAQGAPQAEGEEKGEDSGRDAELIRALEELSDQAGPGAGAADRHPERLKQAPAELIKQLGTGDGPVLPELAKAVAGGDLVEADGANLQEEPLAAGQLAPLLVR